MTVDGVNENFNLGSLGDREVYATLSLSEVKLSDLALLTALAHQMVVGNATVNVFIKDPDEIEEDDGVKVTHDDQTLTRVSEALRNAGLTHEHQRNTAIIEMQNAGILFRERA